MSYNLRQNSLYLYRKSKLWAVHDPLAGSSFYPSFYPFCAISRVWSIHFAKKNIQEAIQGYPETFQEEGRKKGTLGLKSHV